MVRAARSRSGGPHQVLHGDERRAIFIVSVGAESVGDNRASADVDLEAADVCPIAGIGVVSGSGTLAEARVGLRGHLASEGTQSRTGMPTSVLHVGVVSVQPGCVHCSEGRGASPR